MINFQHMPMLMYNQPNDYRVRSEGDFVHTEQTANLAFVFAPLRGQDQQPARLPNRFKSIAGRSGGWREVVWWFCEVRGNKPLTAHHGFEARPAEETLQAQWRFGW